MPAAFTYNPSVQVLDFEEICLLIQIACLICDFCSSGQRFACGFLQIPSRDGHPCRPANDSPCRVRRRLSLPSKSALPGAQDTKRPGAEPGLYRSICAKLSPYGRVLLNHSHDRLFARRAHHALDLFSVSEKNQRWNTFDAVTLRG